VNRTEKPQPFAQRWNPLHEEIFRDYPPAYYRTAFQCEWATDVPFRPGTLARLGTGDSEQDLTWLPSGKELRFAPHFGGYRFQPLSPTSETQSEIRKATDGCRTSTVKVQDSEGGREESNERERDYAEPPSGDRILAAVKRRFGFLPRAQGIVEVAAALWTASLHRF
jgi:hypothetical protein